MKTNAHNKKIMPTDHTECYFAEWLRYEARETQKIFIFIFFLCLSVFSVGPLFQE